MLDFRKSVTRYNPALSAGSAGFCFALVMQVLLTAPVLAQSEQVKIFTAIDCSLHTRSEEDDEVIVFDADYNAALCGDIAALMGRYLAANKKLKTAEIKGEFVTAGLSVSGADNATWISRENSPLEPVAVEELKRLKQVLSQEDNATEIQRALLQGGSPMIFGFDGKLEEAGVGSMASEALKENEYLLIAYLQGKIIDPNSGEEGISASANAGTRIGTSVLSSLLSGGHVTVTVFDQQAPYKHLSLVLLDSEGQVAYSNIKGRGGLGGRNRCLKFAGKVEAGTTDYTARELVCTMRINKEKML
jgi:hypothetical protein